MTDSEVVDVDKILNNTGFNAEKNLLTRRQAEVLALRQKGLRQLDIANLLGTSRANISNIERSAQENIEKATKAIDFSTVLTAPMRVTIPANTDLYKVPKMVYDAADDAGIEVNYTEPNLLAIISDRASTVVKRRTVKNKIVVSITEEGTISVCQRSDRSK